MRFLKQALRSALAGFAALVMVGALFASATEGPDGHKKTLELLATEAPERLGLIFGFGILGAITAAVTTILLRIFDAGPIVKVLLSIVLGPLLPVVLFASHTLKSGKVEDLGAIVLLSAIAGCFAGLLEASRVAAVAVENAARVIAQRDRI